MGLLGGVDKDDFEQFRNDVTRQLKTLEEQVRNKVTDSEELAKKAAANAIAAETTVNAMATKIRAAVTELESLQEAAKTEVETIRTQREVVATTNNSLIEGVKSTQALLAEISEAKKAFDAQVVEVASKLNETKALLEQSKKLPDALAQAEKTLGDLRSSAESVNNIVTHSVTKKGEVDELHKAVFGEDLKDAEGKSQHVDGLKDQLDKSYKELSDKATGLKGEIQNLVEAISEKYQQHLDGQQGEFKQLITNSEERYKSVDEQLKGLLPGAMAAGLSAAYEKKKTEEEDSQRKFEISFQRAIYGLVAISLIPFAADWYLIVEQHKDVVEVIKDTPRLLLSILPLYFPVLWLAYSANKKVNLSKRLIEEYTHKAVLGRTFSGLSNQIETLPHESAVKEELRTRLLYTVMQVSSENPGKLITNYAQSDHPLMEALEKSARLSDLVDTVAKIPGLGPLARKLTEKSDDLLKAAEKKVEAGLVVQEVLSGTSKP